MSRARRLSWKILTAFALLVLLGMLELVLIVHKADSPSTSYANHSGKSPGTKSKFDKSKYSINDPESIWVVVNKGRILPSSYVPPDLVVPKVPLRTSAYDSEMHLRVAPSRAIEKLFNGALSSGIHLRLASGYRSYNEQISVYNSEVRRFGQAVADSESAQPGHSEHQTGLAADLEPASRACEINSCFATTAEGKWLAANCYKYGFIIRYQKNDQNITGYRYEPWHVRYVASDLAAEVHSSSQTLEEFFGLPAVTSYPAQSYQLKIGS